MNIIERLHGASIQGARLERLVHHLAEVVPQGFSVLDVGCGDGRMAARLQAARPDLVVDGIDVLKREKAWIPVQSFDGRTIPFPDASVDVLMFIDVLHHTDNPRDLLREAARVARRTIIVKDHLSDAWFALPTLRFMDRIGNARYGVALPGNYWSRQYWDSVFHALSLKPVEWRGDLRMYPALVDMWFGRSLHFLTQLEVA